MTHSNVPHQPVGFVKRDGKVHVAMGIRKVNGMPFAATKCFLNFIHDFEVVEGPSNCGSCTKV